MARLGATRNVHRILIDQAAGACVVWISEDLGRAADEHPLRGDAQQGRFAGILRTAQADRRTIGRWMAGTS